MFVLFAHYFAVFKKQNVTGHLFENMNEEQRLHFAQQVVAAQRTDELQTLGQDDAEVADEEFDQIDYDDNEHELSQEEVEEITLVLSQLSTESRNELGLNAASWVSFLNVFQSADIYVKKVNEFLVYFLNDTVNYPTKDMNLSLVAYFQSMHDNEIAPTTLQSWLAMFKKFWVHTGMGDLKVKIPIIQENIKKWKKTHTVTKAAVFTKKNLLDYHHLPDTEESLVRKAHSVAAIGLSGRKTELERLDFSDVKKVVPAHGDEVSAEAYYLIRSDKLKSTDPRVANFDASNTSVITEKMEVEALDRYIACFAESDRIGRFFKKLTTRGSRIVATKQAVGEFIVSRCTAFYFNV
jgi:hypothetical protein